MVDVGRIASTLIHLDLFHVRHLRDDASPLEFARPGESAFACLRHPSPYRGVRALNDELSG